jgi:hypothetical protein
MVITPSFQVGDGGLIPLTRSKLLFGVTVAQVFLEHLVVVQIHEEQHIGN